VLQYVGPNWRKETMIWQALSSYKNAFSSQILVLSTHLRTSSQGSQREVPKYWLRCYTTTSQSEELRKDAKLNESGTLVYSGVLWRHYCTVLPLRRWQDDPIENTLKVSTTLLLSYLSSSRCTQTLSISEKWQQRRSISSRQTESSVSQSSQTFSREISTT